MIIFLLNVYIFLLFLLVKLKIIPFNLFWKISPFLVFLLLLVGLFIPMGWGAPAGHVIVGRQSVQIVPNVSGEVIEVPVVPNSPLKAGDVLFKIDPTPYEAEVRALDAQLKLATLRLRQMSELERKDAGTLFNVQQRQSEVDQLRAQLDGAKWNLDKATVRAPAQGYVTNLALRKGARVGNLPLAPVMAFIDTSQTLLVAEVAQNYARYIKVGQPAEVTFKFFPGRVFPARVEAVLQAIASGQVAPGGSAVAPVEAGAIPFAVRLILEDDEIARQLPAGAAGTAAIFTDHVKMAHIIRKVLLRQEAILNYVLPN